MTTETTELATGQSIIEIDAPRVGDVVGGPLVITGTATGPAVAHRLGSDSITFAEGTIEPAADGSLAATVEFTNTCCIEMTLTIFDPVQDPSGTFAVSIPLAYPEPC